LESKDKLCQKIFFKKDEYGPVIKTFNNFEFVQKKVTKEERMEEEFSHGEAMGQMESSINDEILDGDKSL
jgi:hypothetical protein